MMSPLDSSRDPVIVAAARTAVGKGKKGSLASVRPDELAVAVVKELLQRSSGLKPEDIEDLILGCAFPEGEQGLNIARNVVLRSGLPVSVTAETINRYCSSGMQSIAHAAYAIMAGQLDVAIAGGVESMSMVPMMGVKFAPNPTLASEWPSAYLAMGLTAERVAEKYIVSRAEQDAFALASHQKAVAAVNSGRFDEQIVPITVEVNEPPKDGQLKRTEFIFNRDEGPRADTSLEALAKLRPAFKEGGTVTAGNSSQVSDGAAGVVIMSRSKAEACRLKPMARFIAFAVGGVDPEYMGMGPVIAVPKALRIANLSIKDISLIELNEAFAAQGIAVMKELELPGEITNVNGGAIALGHPLGCTGAKLTTQLLYEMKLRDIRFGMVTMCIGGGMGAAGIFENLQ